MNRWQLDVPVVGILRGVAAEFFKDAMAVAFKSGLAAIEVTLNTDNALKIIRQNRPHVPDDTYLGAGTVCCLDQARQAVDSGAMFLVTPNLDIQVIDYAVSKNIPVVAGALTPTEIYTAWASGASMIKIFPCQALGGPKYIKEIRGPFDDICVCAVGGVSVENLNDYFAAGVNAVGVSSALFGKDALKNKDLGLLARNVKRFIDTIRQIK
jgi:2-dehydro-3-deoxyphosphogluconate aldolase/(4S)-4-hydroxy-2-oxoglutarate aldolase